jgi:chromosome segregation ATPase
MSSKKTVDKDKGGSSELLTPSSSFKFRRAKDKDTTLTSARTGFKLGRNRNEEGSTIESVREAFRLEQPEGRSRVYSATRRSSCKQFLVTLTIAAVIAFLIVLVNDAVVVVYLEHQNQQLKDSDTSLAQDAQLGDTSLQTTLMEQIQSLQSNFTAELGAMKLKLSDTEDRLANATNMIVALEHKHLEAFEIMQQALNIAEEKLENATDKISLLEENHAAAVKQMEEELVATNKQLHNATVRIEVLESELSTGIATLNATKASVVAVSELTDRLVLLDGEKASRAELGVLSTNLTQADNEIRQKLDELSNSALNQTHHDQLQDFIAIFASTKANQSDFEMLVARVETLQNSTDELSHTLDDTTGVLQMDIQDLFIVAHNATLAVASKARQLETISEQVAFLNTTKVERAEFDRLSANLTSLRNTTSRTDRQLRYDIDDLADGTINRTHHDELQDIVNMFAETKANLSDLKALEKEVSTLSRDINGSISELTRDLTTLGETVQTVAATVEEQDVDALTNRVGNLDRDLGMLNDTVNAERSEVEQLQSESSSLDGKVTEHISSSQETHNQLASDITDNENQINANTNEISDVEDSISQLQTQSSAYSLGTTSSWMIAITVSLVLLNIVSIPN